MDKTRLAEKRYNDKVKKNNHQLQKTKIQMITHQLNKRRVLIRKQNESNIEKKQYERMQKRENMVEDIDLGRFFELAASN